MGPFPFPRKTKRCRNFDHDGNEKRIPCDYRSVDCWFAHPDDPEWDECRSRYGGPKYPKGPAADLERYNRRRRNGAWSRSRSRSRSVERGRDKGWDGLRGRYYRSRSRSRSPVRRADSVSSSRASAVAGPTSPGYRSREPLRASINKNINNENNSNSPLTSTPSTSIQQTAAPSSPASSFPPPSPIQQQPRPGSPVKLFSPIQRIRPGIATPLQSVATSSSPAATALTILPQPPAVAASTTTTNPTDVSLAPSPGHLSPSPSIPGLTASTKEPQLIREMSTMSLEDGQVMSLEDGQVAEAQQRQEIGTQTLLLSSPLSPMRQLVPAPFLPSFEYEPTPRPEISQEEKIEMWDKRIKIFAELLAYKDKIQGLEADIEDMTRYSASSVFTSLNDDSEEKQRIQSDLEELVSDRDAAIQDLQKGLDELAVGSVSADSAGVGWPSLLDIEEVQKENEKVKEYVVGLADVIKEVSSTLKGLEEFMSKGDDEKKKRKATRRRDKGKEKEAVDDAMDVDKQEVSTTEAAPTQAGNSELVIEDQREGVAPTPETPPPPSRSSEISQIRAQMQLLETSIQDVVISLDQTESTWMQGVKELFQDIVLKQKKTIQKHVGKHKQLIEDHATGLKASLGQVSDNIYASSAKVENEVDKISKAMEKIDLLERERNSLLEGHKKFFEEELPEMKKLFKEYEIRREEDKKRMGALEAALNAFINRPPGEARRMVNGTKVVSKTSAVMTSNATTTFSEGFYNLNRAPMIQTPTPMTPTMHPPTPPASSSLQQSFFSSSTLPLPPLSSSSTLAPPPSTSSTLALPSSSSSSADTSYFLQSIKPHLTCLLRDTVKPLLEEVRKKVEEMVSAQKEEMSMTVYSSMKFTWQILGMIEKRAGIDLKAILSRANTGVAAAAAATIDIDMGGDGEDVGGKGKEKEGENRVNGVNGSGVNGNGVNGNGNGV